MILINLRTSRATYVAAIKISRRKSVRKGSRFSRGTAEQTCRVFVSACLSAAQGFHRYESVGLHRSRARSYIKISPRVAAGETARKGEKRLLSEARVIRRPLRIPDSDRQRNDLRLGGIDNSGFQNPCRGESHFHWPMHDGCST